MTSLNWSNLFLARSMRSRDNNLWTTWEWDSSKGLTFCFFGSGTTNLPVLNLRWLASKWFSVLFFRGHYSLGQGTVLNLPKYAENIIARSESNMIGSHVVCVGYHASINCANKDPTKVGFIGCRSTWFPYRRPVSNILTKTSTPSNRSIRPRLPNSGSANWRLVKSVLKGMGFGGSSHVAFGSLVLYRTCVVYILRALQGWQ